MSTKYRITKNKVKDLWRVEQAKMREFAGQEFIDGWEPVSSHFHSRAEAEQNLVARRHEDDLHTWEPVL